MSKRPCEVTVLPTCTCGAKQWFQCSCQGGQTYTANGHPWEIEDMGAPTPEFVAYVAKRHPGAALRFIELPHLANEYKVALGC